MGRLPAVMPTVLQGAIGFGDGMISGTDVKNAATRQKWHQRQATLFQLVVTGAGLLGGMTRVVGPDVYEPMVGAGVTLLARQLGERVSLGSPVAGAAWAPAGVQGRLAAPHLAGHLPAHAASGRRGGFMIDQVPATLG